MFFKILKTGLLLTALAVIVGCSEPPVPPEVQQAISLERDLWGAGAPVFAPQQYRQYLDALQAGRDLLRAEQEKWRLLRNYATVQKSFDDILTLGRTVETACRENRHREAAQIRASSDLLQRKIGALRALSTNLKDSRLARRKLTESEVLVAEAVRHGNSGRNPEARAALAKAEGNIDVVVGAIRPLLSRFADRKQIERWRARVNASVSSSRTQGGYLIVVEKLERKLTLYRNGKPQRTYPAGLGFNFLSDKLRSGDRATPEGSYQVIRKVPASRYFRALLLNYPNAEDQQRFSRARKEGSLPAGSRIGGLIEIHGGGKDGMTEGCIALEDAQMSELFGLVEVGTPVVIVGTVNPDNIVVSCLRELL